MLRRRSAGFSRSGRRSLLAHGGGWRQRRRLRGRRSREPAGRDPDAETPGRGHARSRRLERARVFGTGAAVAARVAGAGSATAGRDSDRSADVVRSVASRSMKKSWRGGSRRALVDVMEASRELERLRDPLAQWAEELGAAHEKRVSLSRSVHAPGARAAGSSRRPARGLQSSIDALAPVDIEAITGYLSELRKWDKAAGKIGSETASPPATSTRDTQLLMLAALCEQIKTLAAGGEEGRASAPGVQSRGPGLRRVSDEAEGRSRGDPEADQPACGADVRGAPPGREISPRL